ncbi:hypothetical protein, partial [Aeromonas caviae]|uniref:hypothetical protein n=1 Tax=Aeromonas caviae TaxID=648 RepID=UPI003014F882
MGQTAADLLLHLVSRKRDHADIVSDRVVIWPPADRPDAPPSSSGTMRPHVEPIKNVRSQAIVEISLMAGSLYGVRVWLYF